MRLAESAFRAGYRLNSFETLGSTNDEALQRAAAGDRGQLWIVAAMQTAGRGRHGRSWVSPAGNLHASLLLIDTVPPALAWQLGFVAGIALADTLRSLLDQRPDVAIKWPNDVLAGDAKLAGVLCEATRLPTGVFATVLGFGVNCATSPAGLPYRATDLVAISETRPSPDRVFAVLSARLPEVLDQWDRGRAFGAIRAAWLERALPPGTPMSVSAAGQRRAGTFETIDAEGRLVLATADGLMTIDGGDIHLAETPAAAG